MNVDTDKMAEILKANDPLTVFDIVDDNSGKTKMTAMFVLPDLREKVAEFAKCLLSKETNTAAPVKTFNECMDVIAKNYDYQDFEDMFWALSDGEGNGGYKEITQLYGKAAEMYANQPKAPVRIVTDEELRSHADKIYNQWSESDGLSVYDCLVEMAERMRKQLTGE